MPNVHPNQSPIDLNKFVPRGGWSKAVMCACFCSCLAIVLLLPGVYSWDHPNVVCTNVITNVTIVCNMLHSLTWYGMLLRLHWLSGGLQNALPDRQREGGIVMAGPDTFGLPPRRLPGSILRRQVKPRFCLSLS